MSFEKAVSSTEFPAELQDLIDEFESFSIDLIHRVWEDQQQDCFACRDILRALPADFESGPAVLRRQIKPQEEIASATEVVKKCDKPTYKDIVLSSKETSGEEREEHVPLMLPSATRIPWKPKILVSKDSLPGCETFKLAVVDEDDEDERELQWMICCEGSRDVIKVIGGMKRKAHKLRKPDMDRRLKRAAIVMK